MPSTVSVADPAELNLLRQWREPVSSRRVLRAGVGSVLVHVAVVVLIVSLPEAFPPRPPQMAHVEIHNVVHLVMPRFFEPTQKDPNKGKVSRELDVRSAQSAPRPQAPRFRPPQPAPGPKAAPVIEPPKIEQPKLDAPVAAPPPPVIAATSPQPKPPPPPPPAEKPKLAFESVGSMASSTTPPRPDGIVPQVKATVDSAIRNLAPGGGGTVVGDTGDSTSTIPNVSESSSGRIGSTLQLLSDAKGVDFKPYLVQVLTAVRRNWLAILPESARMGRRGRVLVQFAIDKSGGVPKLVIAESSGTEAFDRAAVAAISASILLPPLPAEYKGDQIRLQFAFSYNMPTR
jgi:TonB family protein